MDFFDFADTGVNNLIIGTDDGLVQIFDVVEDNNSDSILTPNLIYSQV